MVATNTTIKLSKNVLMYLLVVRIIIGVILITFGLFILSLGTIHGTTTINGVTSATSFPSIIPAVVLILIGLLIPCYSVLWYSMFSFVVSEKIITINSGVIFRQSRAIDFNKVQNVNNTRGPIQMMFGLTTLNIWTASQDQLSFSTVTIGGVPQTRMKARPDGKLYLTQQDAEELKGYLMNRGNVQNVQVISSNT